MRVAIFTNNYLPNPYGVTGSIESFRKQLEKAGHQVFVFAPYWEGYQDENPKVFRYPSLDINFKFRFPLAIPYSQRMNKILENLKLDIIHAQHPNLLGTAAKKWARRKKIPLVFTWHTLYDQYVNFVPLIPKTWAAKWIIKKAVRFANQCDQIIVPTESVKKIIQNWGVKNENIAAVATGVEEEFFANSERDLVRKKYGIKNDEVLLLLVSRLTEEKNVEFLFRAIVKILQNNNHSLFRKGRSEEGFDAQDKVFQSPPSPLFQKGRIKFLVVGGGYLLEKLRQFAVENSVADKIIFAGEVKREEIKNYYAAGDIFVYASKSETQGMIITEAMYAGLPIVALNATGVCDLVENNRNGFLITESDPSEIAQSSIPPRRDISQGKFTDAVNKLIANQELREKFSQASKIIAREKYTDKICAQKMLAIYKSLIK